MNATLAANGTGVDSAGVATIKNSLVSGNDVGLKSGGAQALASRYNDLFANTTPYAGLAAGTGDLASSVTFVDLTGHNFLLPGPQASTDQGDPGDDVADEPPPNGARDQPRRVRRYGRRRAQRSRRRDRRAGHARAEPVRPDGDPTGRFDAGRDRGRGKRRRLRARRALGRCDIVHCGFWILVLLGLVSAQAAIARTAGIAATASWTAC